MYCISLSDASNCISPERGTRAILKCNHSPISALKLYSGVVVVIGAVPKDRTASRSVTMHLRKRMTVFFSFEVSYWWTCNHQADKNYYRKKKTEEEVSLIFLLAVTHATYQWLHRSLINKPPSLLSNLTSSRRWIQSWNLSWKDFAQLQNPNLQFPECSMKYRMSARCIKSTILGKILPE